jgi:replicative DNA helicase
VSDVLNDPRDEDELEGLPLGDDEPEEAPRPSEPSIAPNNIEAEQALLGAVLFDNAAYERLGDYFKAGHFYEPFHARLFHAMEEHILAGRLADPITLMDQFKRDPAFEELGGLRYLADLVDRAPPAVNAPDYARVLYDLALRRELIRLAGDITMSAGDDLRSAREQMEQIEQRLFALSTSKTQTGLQSMEQVLTDTLEMAAGAYAREGALAGLSTGLIDLDKKTGGLAATDLIVLAGRPSMGKSALAVNISFNVAKQYAFEVQIDGSRKTTAGGVVALFSLEMGVEQLGMRLLGQVSGIPSDRIRRGEIEAQEFGLIRDAAVEIKGVPLFTDATGGISLAALCTRARRLKRTVGLDLIVVDYLGLITLDDDRHHTPQERISAVTAGLKQLAKDLGVPVVALAQLSRKVEEREDKKPQLSDLRDSGSIEQDADVVMFVYRAAYYMERDQPKEGSVEHLKWEEELDKVRHVAEVIIGKQRHGPLGTVRLHFNGNLTLFGNMARESIYQS